MSRTRRSIPLAALALCLGAVPFAGAMAADADAPYSHVDRKNDAGNATGDSQVDHLNNGQLNGNYRGQNALPPGANGGAPDHAAPASPQD